MSIRISGQSEVAAVETTRPAATKTIEADAHSTGYAAPQTTSDRADLSSASSLVLLAKSIPSETKPEKLAALAASVSSGQYRPASSDVSRAIVQGLIRR